MAPQSTPEKAKFKWTYIETIICITAACILATPFLLTNQLRLNDFMETGQIGDTIGGTTAPLIGLLGAWLVYKALKAQIEANNLIIHQFEHQKKDDTSSKTITIVMDQLEVLRTEIKDFKYAGPVLNYTSGQYVTTGAEAIKDFLDTFTLIHTDISDVHKDQFRKINYFVNTIEYLLKQAKNRNINEDDRLFLIRIVLEVYNNSLASAFSDNAAKRIKFQSACKFCGEKHGISESIYKVVDNIVADNVFYILKDQM